MKPTEKEMAALRLIRLSYYPQKYFIMRRDGKVNHERDADNVLFRTHCKNLAAKGIGHIIDGRYYFPDSA